MAGAGADGDMIDIFLQQAGPPTSGGGTTRPSEQRTGVVSQPSAAKVRVIRAASPTPSELSALRAAGIAVDDAGAEGAGAGAGQGPPAAAGQPGAAAPGDEGWRDWAGLPEHLLMNVAAKVVAQTEAGWAAWLKAWGCNESIEEHITQRKRKGNCCLFVFARVCKGWWKAQLKVGDRLRTRVLSDVLLPGSVALAKWALAEGCPRDDEYEYFTQTMAHHAAEFGHTELVKWLCGEGGFAMDEYVMRWAAGSGNLELVKWLRGEGCPCDSWDLDEMCHDAVDKGHVEVLRWARENGCEWHAETRDRAAAELGYTDDFGNLWEYPDDE